MALGWEALEDRRLLATIDLANLGTSGITFYGADIADQSGWSISGAGDMNGDGYDDLAIGAPQADAASNGKPTAGETYVVFGSANPTGPIDLANLGTAGVKIYGVDAGDQSGYSVSGLGDVNGDGFDDLAIGAPKGRGLGNSKTDAGEAYIIFGRSTWSGSIDLASLGTAGVVLCADDAYDASGFALAGAGDVNGDGFEDVVVGAPGASSVWDSRINAGESYLIYGGTSLPATIDLANVGGAGGAAGVKIYGSEAGDGSGIAMGSAGDVDGDGYDDLLVAAAYADTPGPIVDAGEIYLIYGDASLPSSIDISSLGARGTKFYGAGAGDLAGASASGVGDVNGDGYADFLIGVPQAGVLQEGVSLLICGNANLPSFAVVPLAAPGAVAMTIWGADASDHSGISVSAAGDVNADGYDDLLIGADGAAAASNAKAGAGESYVLFGSANPSPVVYLWNLGATEAITVFGARAGDQSGHSVRTAGDLNGDGFDDVLIGAPLADAASDAKDAAGDSYAVFGANSFTSSVTHLGTTGNDWLTGTSSADVMVGGRGNDWMVAVGNGDVLRGGQGDDTLAVPGHYFRRVAGGSGFDTLRIEGTSITTLDLTAIPDARIQGIEQIDLTASWVSTLVLNPLEVLNISDESNTLLVLRDDSVTIPDLVFWTSAGRETIGGRIFDVYTYGEATLKVQVPPGFTVTQSSGTTVVSETGTTDTFTVVLDLQPASNVVIDVTSNDTGEATVSPSSLTFTTANWNTPQAVTVTGIDDFLVDGNQSAPVRLRVNDALSDDTFDPLADKYVYVTVQDNDTAGFALSKTAATVSEDGTSDSWTVVLTAQPASNVVLNVSSANPAEVTVSPALLTFTTGDWNTPQQVTVTGVDDSLPTVDGSAVVAVTVAVNDALSNNAWDPLADQTVSVTNLDNDAPGVVLSKPAAAVSENATSDSWTVALAARPLSDVVLNVSSANTAEVTVTPAQLTFTPADWDTPQEVTVTGADDSPPTVDGDRTVPVTLTVNDALSDDAWDGLADTHVSVTNQDNDTPGFTLSKTSASVSEDGTSDTFTLVLTARPLSTVVLAISGAVSSEVLVSPQNLTFTPDNWASPQTVTLQGADDSPPTVDGDPVVNLSIGVADAFSDDLWDPLPDQLLSVTNLDNDTAGFALDKAVASVSENGTADTFTIVLTAKPLSNVVFDIISGNTSEVAVSPAQRAFTPSNWNVPQTVTLMGVNDSPATLDGSQVALVTVAVNDGASDDSWDPLDGQTVTVTNQDDDLPALWLSKTTATVSESETTDTLTVALAVKPLSNVVLDVSSGNAGEAAVSPTQLTFAPGNWSVPQGVTVTGVDDSPPTVDGNQTVTVTLAVNAAASDDAWDVMAGRAVTVTNQDNDAAGFALDKAALTVSESGTTATFSAVLTARPLSNVVLDVASGNTGEVSVSPVQLTFTSANWDSPQLVTVAGVNDSPPTVDGSQAVLVAVWVNDAASNDAWDPLAGQTVAVTNLDDDSAGFALSKAAVTVSESGASETFTVVLTARPLSAVVFNVGSANAGEATASPAQLSFSPAAWNTPQTVTVAGADDFRLDGNQTTTVTVSVDGTLSNDAWDPLAGQTVAVTNMDDDAAGFALSKTAVAVDEGGGTDTFTVVLTAQPDADVVLLLSSGNSAEATVGPASLTFAPGNWNVAQTATVTGVDDPRIDGPQTAVIAVRVDAGGSDDNFDLLPEQTVSATNADNDSAGFTLSKLAATVSESGTTDTFTVVLTAQPYTDVVFTLTSGDTEEVTVAPASLTFAPGNWNVPQTVTLTGVDDPLIDGSQTTLVTVSVDDANSDTLFGPLPDQSVSVTTTDSGDNAGFELSKTSLTVSESGSTDSFTVVLTAQPDSNVVLNVSSGDTGEVTVSPAALTFTATNWNSSQTVTVTGVDDPRIDGSQMTIVTVSVDAANSDDHFDGVPPQSVDVTTTDDGDVAGFFLTKTAAAVSESGTTDTLGVVLAAQPDTNVVLTVASGDTGEAAANPITLTFTPDNWNVSQTVTITGVDDPLIDGNQLTQVTVSVDAASSDDNFAAVPAQSVTVTTADDDAAGLTLSKTTATVSETGTADAFTVVLNARPNSNVVLSVSNADAGEVTAGPQELTFTPAGWNVPQTVTVSGVQDDRIDGSQQTAVTVSVIASLSDDHFDALPAQSVTVTTTDDDAAGFTLNKSAVTVSESGTQDTFTVALTAEPDTDVVLTVTSGDGAEATVSPSTVTFSPGDWHLPQTVTVTGTDDWLLDGSQTSLVTLSVVDALSDDHFDALPDQTVTTTTTDDDVAGFTLSTSTVAVSETGTQDTFTVVLTARPDTSVVLALASGDVGEAAVSPAELTFTPANWNAPQTVTVTGVNDWRIDGDQVTPVTVSVADGASDDHFDAVADQTVSVTTTDDDVAGLTLNKTAVTVSESGTTATFTVVLTAQPDTDVVVTVGSGDMGEAVVSPGQLTFTPAGWNVPQTVTVTGVNDWRIDGDQVTLVTVSVVDAASDDNFDALESQTVSVTTTDDDVAGLTLNKTALAVSESGTTGTFTVVLTAQPDTDVVLGVGSGDVGEAVVSPGQLTFTPADWNVPQTVTVTGVGDWRIDGSQLTPVMVSIVADSSDDNFDAVADQTVNVTTTDNDVAGFTLSKTTAVVSESGSQDTFTVVLTAEPETDVVLSVASGDTDEVTVSPAALTFTPGDWNVPQTVTVTGANDALIDGSQVTPVLVGVVIAASDERFDAVEDRQVLVTTTDNDLAGFIVSKSTASVSESGSMDIFSVVLTAQPVLNVVLTVTSGDVGEATVSPASVTFAPGNWNMARLVTVSGVDDWLMDGNQITLVTVRVDDAASDDAFDNAADQVVFVTTVDNDTAGLALSRDTAQVSESGSTDSFTVALTVQPHAEVVLSVSSGDTGEATVSPATLTFNPMTWNVPQTVTVQGVDDVLIDGPQLTTVTVSVVDASSDDLFDGAADASVIVTTTDDDWAGFTVSQSTAAVSEAGSTDTFTVALTAQPDTNVVLTVTSGDVTEVTVGPPTLVFSVGNWNVPQTVTVTGVDDKLLDGLQTTPVTVSVADALSDDHFDMLSDQVVTVTTADDDVAGFRLSKVTAFVSENGTSDTFTVVLTAQPDTSVTLAVTSGDTGEATVSPAELTFAPGNWNSPQTVTVTGVDDHFVDGSQATAVWLSVQDAISDSKFADVSDQTVTATTADNDVAGLTLSRTSLTVSEAGSADTFTVALKAQPYSDVVVTAISADLSEATVSPTLLTFTAADWSFPQTVTVTGVDDDLADGNQLTVVTLSVVDEVSADEFDEVPDGAVYVTTTDDDEAGFALSKTAATVSESGTTDTFTVVLTAQPETNVRLRVTGGDTGEATVIPSVLTFTPADWDVPQTVTVTGVDDPVIDGSQLTQVTVSVDDAWSDNRFDPLGDQSVFVTTTDDDAAGFVLSKTAATVSESGTTDTFTVVLTAQPETNVRLTVTSGDTGEATVSPSVLTFAPADWDVLQTVTVTGVDDHVIDGSQLTQVTVSVDDAWSDNQFDSLGDQSVFVTTTDYDAAGFVLSKTEAHVSESGTSDTFTVVLTAQPASAVVFLVSSGDVGEATVAPSALTFTPGNWAVPQTVTVTGVDDTLRDGDQTTSVTVGVDAPSSDDQFDGVSSQIVSVTTADNDVGWHNARNPYDVDGNGWVDASDVLKIINYINGHAGDPSLPPPPAAPPPYYDVNNDGLCTAADVLAVINYINTYGVGSSAEGEGESRGASPAATPTGVPPAATASRQRLHPAVQPLSFRPMNLPQPVSTRRALRTDAVFAAWPEAPWDELADTLVPKLHRVTL